MRERKMYRVSYPFRPNRTGVPFNQPSGRREIRPKGEPTGTGQLDEALEHEKQRQAPVAFRLNDSGEQPSSGR